MKFGKHKKEKEKGAVVVASSSSGGAEISNNAKESTPKKSSKKSKDKDKDSESSSSSVDTTKNSNNNSNNSNNNVNDKIFGGPLPTDEDIPPIIVQTIEYLETYSLKTPGIFRESGSLQLITNYKQLFEARKPVTFAPHEDHVVASILKAYLRELKDPLFSFENYDMFIACESINDETVKLEVVKKVIKLLPVVNIRVLRYLFCFLTKVIANSEQNRMTAESLSIVFLPTILRPLANDHQILQYTVEDSKSTKTLMATIINHYEAIFEDPSVLMPRTRQTRAVTEFVTSTSTPFKFNQITPPPHLYIASPPLPPLPSKSAATISTPSTPTHNNNNNNNNAQPFTPLVLSPRSIDDINVHTTTTSTTSTTTTTTTTTTNNSVTTAIPIADDTGRKEVDSSKTGTSPPSSSSTLSTSPSKSSQTQPPPPSMLPTNKVGGPPPLPVKPNSFLFTTPTINNNNNNNNNTNAIPKPVPKIPKEKTGSSLSVNQQPSTSTSTTPTAPAPTFPNESPKMTRKILFEAETRPRSSTSV